MRTWMWVALAVIGTLVLLVVGIRATLRGRRIPTKAKLVIAGALVWLLSPLDPIPDFAPALGWLDDLTVLIAAVRYVLDQIERAPDHGFDQTVAHRRPIDANELPRRDRRDGDGGPSRPRH